jgi:hypothetical protein
MPGKSVKEIALLPQRNTVMELSNASCPALWPPALKLRRAEYRIR